MCHLTRRQNSIKKKCCFSKNSHIYTVHRSKRKVVQKTTRRHQEIQVDILSTQIDFQVFLKNVTSDQRSIMDIDTAILLCSASAEHDCLACGAIFGKFKKHTRVQRYFTFYRNKVPTKAMPGNVSNQISTTFPGSRRRLGTSDCQYFQDLRCTLKI